MTVGDFFETIENPDRVRIVRQERTCLSDF